VPVERFPQSSLTTRHKRSFFSRSNPFQLQISFTLNFRFWIESSLAKEQWRPRSPSKRCRSDRTIATCGTRISWARSRPTSLVRFLFNQKFVSLYWYDALALLQLLDISGCAGYLIIVIFFLQFAACRYGGKSLIYSFNFNFISCYCWF
jgi:hypothetical protein